MRAVAAKTKSIQIVVTDDVDRDYNSLVQKCESTRSELGDEIIRWVLKHGWPPRSELSADPDFRAQLERIRAEALRRLPVPRNAPDSLFIEMAVGAIDRMIRDGHDPLTFPEPDASKRTRKGSRKR